MEFCQNTRICPYVENIFTETSNFWFGVFVNIFSTYEEMKGLDAERRSSIEGNNKNKKKYKSKK